MSGTSRKKLCLLFSGGVLLLGIGGLMIPVVDMLFKDKIRDTAVISNGSEFWDAWVSPPVPIYMRYYLFNVTNPQGVKDGDKPVLSEQGPYTYREERKKEDIVFHSNGTVSYRERHSYFFDRSRSVGEEEDLITTGNLPILVAVNLMQDATPAERGMVALALSTARQDLFVTRSVHDLLWGYIDPDLEQLKKRRPKMVPTAFVGYFIHRNNTDNGLMTVFTGKNTVDNRGQIDTINGTSRLSYWSTSWANEINGTDGSIFPPFQHGTQSLNVFASEVCRSSQAVYQKDVETKQSIRLRRFVPSQHSLQNASAYPDNLGFCTPQTKCLSTGLLNITNCIMGRDNFTVPAVASFPHFFMADPSVQQSVEGLRPDPAVHQTAIDIEPWTGLVLQAYKRVQINMHVMKLEGFTQTYNIRTLFFPIFWISETAEIDNEQATRLQRNLFAPMEISAVLEKVFLITGTPLVLAVMIITCRNRRRRHQGLMGTLPPGPVPNTTLTTPNTISTSSRAGRLAKRGGAHSGKEAVPLLPEKRGSGASSPSSPPPPVPSYQRPPLSNSHHNQRHHAAVTSMEPMYQTALDA